MATIFCDANSIIFIDYIEKGRKITGEYYTALLDQLNVETSSRNGSHLVKKKVLFRQGNAPGHKGAIAMAILHELRYQLLRHPPYSSDLTPSDFFLSPNMKKMPHYQKIYN